MLTVMPNRIWLSVFPLIPELLSDPFEIWVSGEASSAGDFRVRERIIKAVELPDRKGLMLVADYVEAMFIGLTFVPTSKLRYLHKIRTGVLLYGRR